MEGRTAPYFWGRRNVPLLYALFPLIVVLSAFELVLFFPKVNPTIIEASMVVPTVVVGVLLLRSARRFNGDTAEGQAVHYLRRWNRVKNLYDITLSGSGLLAVYAVLKGGSILVGNFPEIFLEAVGLFYLIDMYTMLLPIRFWSPKATDYSRMYLAAMSEGPESEAGYLDRLLHLFAKSYVKYSRRNLHQQVFRSALSLCHDDKRNLALRLNHAIQSGDYEDAIHALVASISTDRETILAGRRRPGEALLGNRTLKVLFPAVVIVIALGVAYLSAIALGSNAVASFQMNIGLIVVTAVLGAAAIGAAFWVAEIRH